MATTPSKSTPSIGSMNKVVGFQAQTAEDDGGGGIVTTWATQFKFFANVSIVALQTGAKQVFEADKYREEIEYVIKTRYDSRITDAGRLVYNGRWCRIKLAIPTDEEHRFMRIICVDRGDATI